jgi:hypothetical protein
VTVCKPCPTEKGPPACGSRTDLRTARSALLEADDRKAAASSPPSGDLPHHRDPSFAARARGNLSSDRLAAEFGCSSGEFEQGDLVLATAERRHAERRIGVAGAAERAADSGRRLIEHGVGIFHQRAMISAGQFDELRSDEILPHTREPLDFPEATR